MCVLLIIEMPCDWRVYVGLIDSRGWTTSTRCSDEWRVEWKCARTSATRKHTQRRTNPTMIYVLLAWLSNEISLALYVFICVCGKARVLLVLSLMITEMHLLLWQSWMRTVVYRMPSDRLGRAQCGRVLNTKIEHNIPAFTFELSDFILRW